MAEIPGLKDFLAREGRRPFEWSRSDQWMFIADWIAERTGRDIARGWRGLYDSCDAACAMVEQCGMRGPLHACFEIMRRHGFERTRCPIAGDVAVIVDRDATGRAWIVPAICMDSRLRAIRLRRGVAVGRPRTVRAWKLPNG